MRGLLRISVALLLIAPLASVTPTYAEAPELIITEIKIRNDLSGFDEFIEVFNPTDTEVSLGDYFIGYVNSPAPTVDQTFATSVVGEGLLASGQSLVLAKNELDPNLPNAQKSPFTSLSDSGGTLRLIDVDDNVIDQFAWTSTAADAIEPTQYLCTSSTTTCNLNKTQSFTREQNTDGSYVLTNPTWQLTEPSPQSAVLSPLPTPEPEEDPTEEDTTSQEAQETPDPVASTEALLPPEITELLPNPAAPASDSTDEYVELHNPNDQELDLSGYKLQSGSTFTYSHTFGSTVLAPFEYKSFFVSETGAILSNAGGQVRLLDSSATVVSQTNVYDSAEEGEAWALVNGVWTWTTTPTPHAANILTASVLKVAATKPAKTKKAAAAKKTAAKKKKAAAKTTKKPAAAAAERQVYEDPDEVAVSLHPGILAGVGLLTLVYAAYEYRYDATNRMQQLRRHREIRRATRP